MKLKKFIALALAFVMAFSTMSFTAFAADEESSITTVYSAEAFWTALKTDKQILLAADITVETAITVPDDVIIDLNEKTLYVNVENSYYNNVTIKNGNIVLGKDDVHVCDGYFLVNEGKTLKLDGVNMSSADGGIKGYAVFHLKTGANLDVVNSTLNITDNEYEAGYIVYAGESTATVDISGSTVTGANVNGIVHATTVIEDSTFTVGANEHGINRSAVTINDSTVTISGGTGRGITAQHGDLVINGNSVVNISNMGEATIELRNNKNLAVADTATVIVDVAVNNTTNGTITGTVTVEGDSNEEDNTSYAAYIGEQGYEKLQYAINAAQNGNTITLASDCADDVTIIQAKDVAFTIDGDNNTMSGTITIDGKSQAYATAGLTIKNVNFDATGIAKDASINLGGTSATRYTSNVTVDNCTFTGTGNAKVAVKNYTGGCKNVSITNCTANGLHSLAQLKTSTNVTVTGCKANDCKNGISLGSSTGVTISDNEMELSGYGIRADGGAEVTISNCEIEAFIPVVVRNASADATLTFDGTNTMRESNTDGIWCAIGTSEYETNGTLPTSPTADIVVTLNDTGLAESGVYGAYEAPATTYEVSTKTELDTAIANAADGDTILLTADIDYGATQLKIEKAITLNLGGKTLTNSFGYGGLALKGGCSIKNGTVAHKGTVCAIKAWDVVLMEDLVIDVAFKAEGKVIGGIVLQENCEGIDTIRNVTIQGEGLTNGIETYNCGNATEPVIGSMENVSINAVGTGMLISAPCGTATNCDIKGGVTGIEIWIKGTYSASLDLVNSIVKGDMQAVYAHDEENSNPNIVNSGSITLTADDTTTFESAGSKLNQVYKRITEEQVILPEAILPVVAQVGNEYYTSIEKAIEAAAATEEKVVTALETIILDEDGTLDLKGVRINAANSIQNAPVFRVLADVTVTNGIVDGRGPVAGEGGINCYAFIVGKGETAGTLTIKDGTYRGVTTAVQISNGTVNISGGVFQTGHDNEGTDYGATYLLNCMDAAYNNGTAKFNITGGKFIGFNPENNAAEGTGTNFLDDNYKACDRAGDDKWYVAETNVLVTGTKEDGTPYNGDLYFTTIYDALDFIQPRDTATIKLLNDITITSNQRMFNNYSFIVNAEYITLDLNGKTLTFDYEGSTKECLASIAIYNKGTLTIIDTSDDQDGTIYNKTTIQGYAGPRIIWVTSAGSATIEAGRFISDQAHTMFYTSNSNPDIPTTLTINGGYFEQTTESDEGYRYFNMQNGYQKQIITVNGGIFAHNPTDSEMQFADGYKAEQNSDGTWGVVEANFVAKVGKYSYSSLQEAVNAAVDGDTIVILDDIVLEDTLTIASDDEITLDLAGYTISQEKSCTESYSMIENKGNLTITGEGTISFTDTGDGDSTFGWGSYTITNRGTLVVENGTVENLSTQNPGNGNANLHMYCAIQQAGGTVTINDGTISTPTYRSIRVNKGSLVINGGNFEGQVWLQPNQGNTTIKVTGGTFAPRGNDGSSIFMTNAGEGYTVTETSISGGTFTTKIGATNPEALAGVITGGKFSASAKAYTNSALINSNFEFGEEVDGYYGLVEKEQEEEDTPFKDTLLFIANVDDETYEGDKYHPLYVATSIDSLNYSKVGFDYTFTIFDPETGEVEFEATYQTQTKEVYDSISDANYTYTVEDIGGEGKYLFMNKLWFDSAIYHNNNTKFTITPYAYTLSGKKITGWTIEMSNDIYKSWQTGDYKKDMFKEGN